MPAAPPSAAPNQARPTSALARRRALWLIAPVLAACALSAATRPLGKAPPSASSAAKSPPAGGAAAAPRLRERCSFSPGDRVSYEVRFDERAELDASKLLGSGSGSAAPAAPAAARMDLSVTARLELVGLSTEGDASVVAARFVGATAVDRAGGSGGPLEGVDRPFLFRMNGRCGVDALARHREAPVPVARRQHGMLLAFEALLPEHGERTYEAEQRDATGVFKARYGHGAAGGAAVVERKIHGYGRLWSADPRGGKAQGFVTASRGVIEPGAGPWFERFHEETSVSIRTAGAILGSTSVKKDARRLEGDGGALDASSIDPGDYLWGDVFEQRSTEAPAPSAEEQEIAALSHQALVARYLAAASSPGAKVGRTVRLLVAYLRAHPERAGELLSAVRAGQIPADRASPVFAALGQAGGAECERALLGAASGRKWGEVDRSRAIVALSTMKGAGTGAAEALRSLSLGGSGKEELVSSSAMMALGAMAGRGSSASPEAALSARASLRQALSGARDKTELKSALAAAGNAGLEELLPDIDKGLRHDDPSVRAQAALALRGLPAEVTVASMSSTLSTEPDAGVRRAMLEVTSEQAERGGLPEATLSTVQSSLARETDPASAAAQVRILGASLKSHPELRASLVARFRMERDPSVLRLIGSYLGAEEL